MSENLNVEEVSFQVEGTTVRGDLYTPVGDADAWPVVVMAGGWCYVKELRQPDYAKEFAANGLAALIIDYRNFGASDGEPRQHLDPWRQIEDYRSAISYVASRPDLDGERIGVWGISYSGGHVIILSAVDHRVKAAVSNVPVIDGWQNMWRVHGSERFRILKQALDEDRQKRIQTGEFGPIAMSAPPSEGLAAWPFEEVRTVFHELQRTEAPAHEHWSTMASVDLLMQYNALPYASRIFDTPFMMITASGDDITPEDWEVEAFNAIRCPIKKLVRLPETTHMRLYSDLNRLEMAAKAAASWFVDHLIAPITMDTLLGGRPI
ncbi:MAG: alpha/beta hydrolase [bacterium]|nr:alpha/beta hydrolase [bacterium]